MERGVNSLLSIFFHPFTTVIIDMARFFTVMTSQPDLLFFLDNRLEVILSLWVLIVHHRFPNS